MAEVRARWDGTPVGLASCQYPGCEGGAVLVLRQAQAGLLIHHDRHAGYSAAFVLTDQEAAVLGVAKYEQAAGFDEWLAACHGDAAGEVAGDVEQLRGPVRHLS